MAIGTMKSSLAIQITDYIISRHCLSTTAGAQPPERSDRGAGEQAAANGLGGVVQEREVSAAGPGGVELRNRR